MYRRILSVMFAVGLAVMLALPAAAAGEGKIQVSPQRGGMLVPGGEITLYRVGKAVEGGYRLSAGVADWIVEDTDIFDPEIAQWMAKSTTEKGTRQAVGDAGSVTFTGLDAGVYLVVQSEAAEGYEAFAPFLVVLPAAGPKWEVPAYPKVDKVPEDNPKTADPMDLMYGSMGMGASGLGLLILFRMRKRDGK